MAEILITSFEDARECYRSKDLRQALYDAGEVIMGDVLVNLHGDEHRARRRLENRLFRRDTFFHYERDLFPEIIEKTVKPYIADGKAELVDFGHQMMMNLAALTAGVDRPRGTPEETFHLYDYLGTFIEGATLAHYTGDKDANRLEIEAQLLKFDEEFLEPGIVRRRSLLAQFEAGEIEEEELPRDVLMVFTAEPGQGGVEPREPATRDCLLSARGSAHLGDRVHSLHAQHLQMARGPPRRRRSGSQRPRVRAALHP